jgi:hypothetical protein
VKLDLLNKQQMVHKLPRRNKMFSLTAGLTDITNLETALANPESNVANPAERMAGLWNRN